MRDTQVVSAMGLGAKGEIEKQKVQPEELDSSE